MNEYDKFVRRVIRTTLLVSGGGMLIMLAAGWAEVIHWYALGVLLGLFNFYAHAWSVQAMVQARRPSWRSGLAFLGRFAIVAVILIVLQLWVGLALFPVVIGFFLSYIVLFATGYCQSRAYCITDSVDVSEN